MRGIMLAGIKSGHNKIKQLESENEQLKARLDAIEAKLKD
jgi:outer membrane murein-binding lipoprotein Lpp